MDNRMKHRTFTRIVTAALALSMLFSFTAVLVPTASAAAKLTKTVNLSLPRRDITDHGYTWDNRNATLTLDGLYIDTKDDYGLKITSGATVILKGQNYIKASRAALALAGTVTFKGSGTLTLVSDDMGIYCYSTDDSTTVRFMSGKYDIKAGGDGIYSTHSTVSFIDGDWKIQASTPENFAINGRVLKLYGGKMTMDNAVHATLHLDIQALSLSVAAEKPALTSDKNLTIADVEILAGSHADSLEELSEYSGENCVKMKSIRKDTRTSIFFGESVPRTVDHIVLVVLLALFTAGIAIPFVLNQKKTKRALAKAAEEQAAAEAKRTAEKQSRK
ncbi:MAG: carbohydrate-binding domain-containing protein [Clostridia bacterium]|nr:carbohydrate-binding domain-containing protein [Clostridia bacterium]